MAGIDENKTLKRRRRRDLLSASADQRRAKREAASPVGLQAAPPKEKTGWYVSPELADMVRDAVTLLNERGMRINGLKVTAGTLVEPILRQGLEALAEEHNDGEPFPVCAASRAAEKRRQS